MFTPNLEKIESTGAETGSASLSVLRSLNELASRAPLCNFTATSNPTSANNASQGYLINSWWLNTSTSTMYQCQASTTSTATWVATGIGGATSPAGSSTQVQINASGSFGVGAAPITVNLTTGATVFPSTISTAGNATINNLELGLWTGSAGFAMMAYTGHNNSTDYTVMAQSNGNTFINATTGRTVSLRVNNTDTAVVDSSKIAVTGNIALTGLITKGGQSINVSNTAIGGGLNAIDYNLISGGIFRIVGANVYGTTDVFFQSLPPSGASYTVLEDYAGAGLVNSTGGAVPIIFAPNRTEAGRWTPSGTLIAKTLVHIGPVTVGAGTRQLHVAGAEAALMIEDTTSASDEKKWALYGSASNFIFAASADDETAGSSIFQVARSGYNAANFSFQINVDAPSFSCGSVAGFTGSGAYTNFEVNGGIITNAS